ncbi:TSYL2 protein, partial [Climacteris rufus]|nr:TSYL2 protein [Climacteris rufus]
TREVTGDEETTNGLEGSLETTRETLGSLETTSGCKGSLEIINGFKGSLETTSTHCLEQEKGGLETTTEVTEGLETTKKDTGGLKTTSGLEIAVTHFSEEDKGVLEPSVESRGSLETTREAMGDLDTTREVTGSLGTTNGRKGSLETAVTRCLKQGRRSKGGLETTPKVLEDVESDAPSGGLKSTSRRKAGLKTPTRPTGSVETASIQCLDWERSGKEGLESTSEVLGGVETTIIGHVKWDREQKGGLETTTEPEEGLEPTPTACVGQSWGGPGLPDLVGVPEPAGVPAPKEQVAEESAVISLGEDEEEEEEERDEGPARYLAALEAVQLELEAVEEEAARAFRRLRARFCLRRRPHLQRRNRLIQHIPGFWVTAFLNHPQLSAMISDRDEDALSYMTSLQVPGVGVGGELGGHLVSHSTPIRWWQGQDPRSRPHKGPPAPRSFFAWFGDHSFPAGDRVAEIIKEELWPNPLQFYLLGEGAEGPPDSESGEDCVVILDDDEDVQEIPDDGDG